MRVWIELRQRQGENKILNVSKTRMGNGNNGVRKRKGIVWGLRYSLKVIVPTGAILEKKHIRSLRMTAERILIKLEWE